MAELLANNAASTLTAAIPDAVVTTLTVANGSVFPATGNFRIIVDSELMLCTSRAVNVLTVTRGVETTTAVAHSNGAAVTHVVTSAGLAQYVAEHVVASSYATSLPGSPFDGQEAVLVDSTSAPTYVWRFRYNAGSASAFKWEFIGGTPARATVITQETSTTVTTWVDLATVGPRIIVPRAGDYDADGDALLSHSVLSTSVWVGVTIGATNPPVQQPYIQVMQALHFGFNRSRVRYTGLAASDDLRLRYFMSAAGTMYAQTRTIAVTPVRVS